MGIDVTSQKFDFSPLSKVTSLRLDSSEKVTDTAKDDRNIALEFATAPKLKEILGAISTGEKSQSDKVTYEITHSELNGDIQEVKMSNGLTVVNIHDKAAGTGNILNLIIPFSPKGRLEQGDPDGIWHFLEHSLLLSPIPGERKNIFDLVNDSGGQCNAMTSHDSMVFTFDVDNNIKDKVLDYMAKILDSKMELDSGVIEHERQVIHGERVQTCTNPHMKVFLETNKNIYGAEHHKSMDLAGTHKEIDAITKADLERYFQTFDISKATLISSADLSTDKAMTQIAKHLADVKAKSEQQFDETVLALDKPLKNDLVFTDKALSNSLTADVRLSAKLAYKMQNDPIYRTAYAVMVNRFWHAGDSIVQSALNQDHLDKDTALAQLPSMPIGSNELLFPVEVSKPDLLKPVKKILIDGLDNIATMHVDKDNIEDIHNAFMVQYEALKEEPAQSMLGLVTDSKLQNFNWKNIFADTKDTLKDCLDDPTILSKLNNAIKDIGAEVADTSRRVIVQTEQGFISNLPKDDSINYQGKIIQPIRAHTSDVKPGAVVPKKIDDVVLEPLDTKVKLVKTNKAHKIIDKDTRFVRSELVMPLSNYTDHTQKDQIMVSLIAQLSDSLGFAGLSPKETESYNAKHGIGFTIHKEQQEHYGGNYLNLTFQTLANKGTSGVKALLRIIDKPNFMEPIYHDKAEHELEKIKSVILEIIRREEGDKGYVHNQVFRDTLFNNIPEKTFLSMGDKKEFIKNLNLKDLQDYYKAVFHFDDAHITYSFNDDDPSLDATVNAFKTKYNQAHKTSRVVTQRKQYEYSIPKGINTFKIKSNNSSLYKMTIGGLSNPVDKLTTKEKLAVAIGLSAFAGDPINSRLGKPTRDAGIYSFNFDSDRSAKLFDGFYKASKIPFHLTTATSKDKLKDFKEIFFKVFNEVNNDGFTDDEVRRAKQSMIISNNRLNSSPALRFENVAMASSRAVDIDELEKAISEVTVEDVNKIFKQVFNSKDFVIVEDS